MGGEDALPKKKSQFGGKTVFESESSGSCSMVLGKEEEQLFFLLQEFSGEKYQAFPTCCIKTYL